MGLNTKDRGKIVDCAGKQKQQQENLATSQLGKIEGTYNTVCPPV
jgi:hypothetical protein